MSTVQDVQCNSIPSAATKPLIKTHWMMENKPWQKAFIAEKANNFRLHGGHDHIQKIQYLSKRSKKSKKKNWKTK